MKRLNEALQTNLELKSLNAQLEDDLRKVNAVSSMFRGDAEGEPAQESEIMADAVRGVTGDAETKLSTAADSIIPILKGQRERFRVRAQELETELLALQQKNQSQQNEMDRVRSDNVKLYEKIKFLQNYSGSRSTTHANDDAESRYALHYEEKLDPFTNFSRKERMKRYTNLRPHEKITLSIGRFVMGNTTARTFAFIYALLLHLLVFLSLYKLVSWDDALVTENVCHKKFADHMLNFHRDEHLHTG